MSKAPEKAEKVAAIGAVDYISFINNLLQLRNNLPLAMPKFNDGMSHLQAGMEDFKEGGYLLAGQQPPSPAEFLLGGTMQVGPEEAAVEQKLLVALREGEHGHNFRAIGDGQIIAAIRNLYIFLNANPQLMQWLMTLIASLLSGKPTPTPAPVQV